MQANLEPEAPSPGRLDTSGHRRPPPSPGRSTEGRSAESRLTTGTLLASRYELRATLGQGATATVYRALDMRLNREVAVKVIHPNRITEGNVVRRFFTEAEWIAGLDSPHVVPIYDVARDGAHVFLVMKLLQGPSLQDILDREKPLSLERSIHLVEQILQGLSHLHEKNLVHRDVKPSNVIITDNDRAVLLDLGISRPVSNTRGFTTEEVLLCGTPEYMSPERVMQEHVDHRCDVYSAGIVLFELLTGQTPFNGQTPLAICLHQVNDPPPRPSRLCRAINPALEAVILRALEKDPELRFQSAEAMRTALLASRSESFLSDFLGSDRSGHFSALSTMLPDLFPTERETPPAEEHEDLFHTPLTDPFPTVRETPLDARQEDPFSVALTDPFPTERVTTDEELVFPAEEPPAAYNRAAAPSPEAPTPPQSQRVDTSDLWFALIKQEDARRDIVTLEQQRPTAEWKDSELEPAPTPQDNRGLLAILAVLLLTTAGTLLFGQLGLGTGDSPSPKGVPLLKDDWVAMSSSRARLQDDRRVEERPLVLVPQQEEDAVSDPTTPIPAPAGTAALTQRAVTAEPPSILTPTPGLLNARATAASQEAPAQNRSRAQSAASQSGASKTVKATGSAQPTQTAKAQSLQTAKAQPTQTAKAQPTSISKLETAVKQSPDKPELLISLGDAYLRSGNRVAAIAAYRRYLVLKPEGKLAPKARNKVNALTGG